MRKTDVYGVIALALMAGSAALVLGGVWWVLP